MNEKKRVFIKSQAELNRIILNLLSSKSIKKFNLLVMKDTGHILYKYGQNLDLKHPHLLSGFLSGVTSLMKEAIAENPQEIKKINTEDFVIYKKKINSIEFYLITQSEHPDFEFSLTKFSEDFFSRFKTEIQKKSSDLNQFREAEEIILKYFN